MNRSRYFDYINEKLVALATSIEIRGQLNILSFHVHSENFYRDFFNALFDLALENLNATTKQNVEAIDLVDHAKQLVVQVSATATKQKVESALTKDLSAYASYTFKFISISKDASALRTQTFKNPHGLKFVPQGDVYDIKKILGLVQELQIDKLRLIHEFIKNELGSESTPQKIESNLATIIDILAKVDWTETTSSLVTTPYDVEQKIEFNKLNAARGSIEAYKIHYGRLDMIYSEFDKQGVNKSQSILDSIRNVYLVNQNKFANDELFFKVVDEVTERIQTSRNYVSIPYEELELGVNILVVDAFIRCKIFENPETESHVASG